jgi:hypothetical protein
MSETFEAMTAVAQKDAQARLDALGEPIDLAVGRSASYSALLRGEFDERLTPRELLEWASRLGRVILSGRGGAGKTTLMNRLVVEAAKSGRVPLPVNLSRWDHAATDAWRETRHNARQSADFLLRRFGTISANMLQVESIYAGRERVLLLDGLNEVPGSVADEILAVGDRLAALMVNFSIVAADRLVRRRIDGEDERWCFAAPLPVADAEQARLVPADSVPPPNRKLLESPFFVDRAIRGELGASALATIRAHVEQHGGIPPSLLESVAEASFRAYAYEASRSFSIERFREAKAEEAIEPMLASGLLVQTGDERVAYIHHWFHDYLASRHVVGSPTLLDLKRRHATLDALTFRANSFDAVAFALEQFSTADSDAFLRAVYDWNPYAAGYALAEIYAAGGGCVSTSLRTVMLAMLADKRFDRHFLSARRAADALDLFRDKEAVLLRSVSNREDLIQYVVDVPPGDAEFETWRAVFIIPSGEPAPGWVLDALVGDDSIVGWTAANVTKRLVLDSGQLSHVVEATTASAPVVRWRACHVLGAFGEPVALGALLDRVVHDDDENVRYGAVRSLVEMASLSEEQSIAVTGRLEPLIQDIARSPRVMTELTRAVFLARGTIPPNWSARISELLYPQALASQDETRLEEWSRISASLRGHERELVEA